MKMKMYQVPVTEMYAVRSQVVMDGSVMKGDNAPGSNWTLPSDPDNPFDPTPGTPTD